MIRLLEATIRPLRTHFLVLTERIRHRVAYNPFGDAITQDPYPTYAALRARSPVHRSLLTHAWVLTRYADVDAVLRDHRRFSNDPRRREAAHRGIGALPAGTDDYSRLLLDPPEHTRLRRLVNEAFTPRAVEALEPRIRTITAELLERVATLASFDLVRDVAQPAPPASHHVDAGCTSGKLQAFRGVVEAARTAAGVDGHRARAGEREGRGPGDGRDLRADHGSAARGTTGRHYQCIGARQPSTASG